MNNWLTVDEQLANRIWTIG